MSIAFNTYNTLETFWFEVTEQGCSIDAILALGSYSFLFSCHMHHLSLMSKVLGLKVSFPGVMQDTFTSQSATVIVKYILNMVIEFVFMCRVLLEFPIYFVLPYHHHQLSIFKYYFMVSLLDVSD
jgi:hypothetical protein